MKPMKPFFLLLLLCGSLTAGAQTAAAPVNTSDFMKDCVMSSGEAGNKQMALWLPTAFWQMIGQQMKIQPDVMEPLLDEMNRYMMFAVVETRFTNGEVTLLPDESIRPSLRLYDSAGNEYLPIEEKKLSQMTTSLLLAFKPKLAQLMGQLGEGMQVYLFDAKKFNARTKIDLAQPNHFSLAWNQARLEWKLPFASMLQPKHCPTDHAEMQGNWNYCPFHGVKL